MSQQMHTLTVPCNGRGFYNITPEIRQWVREAGIRTGLLNLFVQHTSCSLIIQENADPDVLHDMESFMAGLVADGDPGYRHRDEGPDDMSAHIRMALTSVSLNIPVQNAAPALGMWQAVYIYEHRCQPLTRRVIMHVSGDA
ncbi:MAG TPA: secondary thiamine-phosphate synthase enzyme YjbQ [Mariprofundaceae bacterium]|nr:secondary thiamine-phosphate synthase enzyme YjbQ [Mariprofundaceae bacterium]